MSAADESSAESAGSSSSVPELPELEDVLSSSCPLCDSVVAGLDRPFVLAGEGDSSWSL